MKIENLNEEDISLIKTAMLENSVSLVSSALECKEVMPTECYDRDMKNADRLVYLINVLNGVSDYDR